MLKLPLGVFSRNRLDWSLDQLMIGSISDQGQNGPVRTSLNNSSKTGFALAVYAILAWRPGRPPTWIAGLVSGVESGGNTPNVRAFLPNRPTVDGSLSQITDASNSQPLEGLRFIGDGVNWMLLPEIPLFVIPVGMRLSLTPAIINGNRPAPEPTSVTFIWGYHADPTFLQRLLG
jgi:hypothetical protein